MKCPYPRCEGELSAPFNSGTKTYCLCDTCGRKASYRVVGHVDETQSCETSTAGRRSQDLVLMTFRVPRPTSEALRSLPHGTQAAVVNKGLAGAVARYKRNTESVKP